jgi:hypothetical protein
MSAGLPRLLLFYRVFGCFSAMGVKNESTEKSVLRFTKNRVEKFFYKKIDKKSKTEFSFFSVFG